MWLMAILTSNSVELLCLLVEIFLTLELRSLDKQITESWKQEGKKNTSEMPGLIANETTPTSIS